MPITCTGGVVCLLLCITKCYIFNWNVAVLVKNWSNSFWVSLVHVIIINNHLLQLYMNILFFPLLRTSREREVKKELLFMRTTGGCRREKLGFFFGKLYGSSFFVLWDNYCV